MCWDFRCSFCECPKFSDEVSPPLPPSWLSPVWNTTLKFPEKAERNQWNNARTGEIQLTNRGNHSIYVGSITNEGLSGAFAILLESSKWDLIFLVSIFSRLQRTLVNTRVQFSSYSLIMGSKKDAAVSFQPNCFQ